MSQHRAVSAGVGPLASAGPAEDGRPDLCHAGCATVCSLWLPRSWRLGPGWRSR